MTYAEEDFEVPPDFTPPKSLTEQLIDYLNEEGADMRECQEVAEHHVRILLGQALRAAHEMDWCWGAGPLDNTRYAFEELAQRWEPLPRRPPRPVKKPIPAALRRAVLERDAYRCQWPACGTWLDLTVDHIIPESLGGPTEVDNLQALCRPHNSEKGVRVL